MRDLRDWLFSPEMLLLPALTLLLAPLSLAPWLFAFGAGFGSAGERLRGRAGGLVPLLERGG